MTIGTQWAWKPNDEVKSLEQCLHSLIRSAGGDGNLLFNVGPNQYGTLNRFRLTGCVKWVNGFKNTGIQFMVQGEALLNLLTGE